jgi:hypothetical protein
MKLKFVAFFLLAASHQFTSVGHGGVLFGGGQQSKQLYQINPVTGVRSPTAFSPQALANFFGFNGLAYNTRDGFLYGTTTNLTGVPGPRSPGAGDRFYRIHPVTFQTQTFQITGLTLPIGASIDGLEYDHNRNVFWATVPARQELIRINAETLAATVVADNLGPGIISGLAYDGQTDTLYGVNDFGFGSGENLSRLLAIDPTTFACVQVGPAGLALGLNDLDSLAFDPIGRWLYSINDTAPTYTPNQQLVRIDPSTGLATAIGAPYMTLEGYQGLAFIVPEPPTGLLAIGALLGGLLISRS